MKTRSLLEQLIRKIIVEQEIDHNAVIHATGDSTDMTADAVYMSGAGIISSGRYVVKPVSKSALSIAKQHGAIINGWSAFTVKSVYKRGQKETSRTDSGAAYNAIQIATTADKQEQYYSANGHYTGIVNGIPKYMYIVGPDISKRDRVLKRNVWVCNFEQLYNISKKLDTSNSLLYHTKIEGIVESKTTMLGDIIIFSSYDIRNWFSVLKQRIKESGLTFKPVDSNVLIPEIDYLAKDYDPSDIDAVPPPADVDLTIKDIVVTDSNSKDWDNTLFRGTALIDHDKFGNRILIMKTGTIDVYKRSPITSDDKESEEINGKFTGEFKNGKPYDGVVMWDNDTQFKGKIKETDVYATVNGFMLDIPNETVTTVKTSDPIEAAEDENKPITFPYEVTTDTRTSDPYTVITTGDTDPYLYYKTSAGKWWATKRDAIGNGGDLIWNLINSKAAIKVLEKTKNETPNFKEYIVKSSSEVNSGFKSININTTSKTPEKSAESTPTPGTITYPYTWKSGAGTFNVITTNSQPGQVFFKDKNQWYSSNQSKFEAAEKSPKSVSLSILPVTNSKLAAELNNIKPGTKTKSVEEKPIVTATTKVTFKKPIGQGVTLYNWNNTTKKFEYAHYDYAIEKSYNIQNLGKSTGGAYTKIKFADGKIYWVLTSELK
jgi:hypothetical protein